MENKNNLVHSVKATLVCITLPGSCKPIFTSQLTEGLCWAAGRALWNWAFNFHGELPGLKWSEWDENLQLKCMAPSAFSQREMESLPATAGATRSKNDTKMGVTTILKKVSRKDGMHPLCGVPPSLHWLQEKHKLCFWLFAQLYTPKICVWSNSSRKMAYCLCRCQGCGTDKQRTPLCYWSGLLHPTIFRVKKPNSTNRICVCSYLVCLDF